MEDVTTRKILFTCKPEDIVYVNGVFDSYGGLGLVRTLNTKNFNCAIYSTGTIYKTALDVLYALKDEGVGITEISVVATESVD